MNCCVSAGGVLASVLLLIACQSPPPSESPSAMVTIKTKVTVAPVRLANLTLAIQSNGKLEAVRKVELRFEHEGLVELVAVGNGSPLSAGMLVARQNDDYPLAEQAKIEEARQKAQLSVQDIQLGAGYADTSTVIPDGVKAMARVRSGLAEVHQQAVLNRRRLISTRLTAPFEGIAANVSVRAGDMVSAGQRVCTLIDNSELWVNFYILENELGLVRIGDAVQVSPLAWPGKNVTGSVRQINPFVDAHGFIEIKALVSNQKSDLVDGMNVDVAIVEHLAGVIVIPKKAVVKRQGRQVVFVLKKGRAIWSYVETGAQSVDSVAVTSGLRIGDELIVSGNEHLVHDVEVEVMVSSEEELTTSPLP